MRKVIKMSSSFNNFMREICRQAVEKDIARLDRPEFNAMPARTLSEEEVPALALKITALPAEYMHTLFFRYYFNFSPEDADAMLVTTHSAGRLRYIRRMLSRFMGLESSTVVDDDSMKLACEAAISAYAVRDIPDVWRIPQYSNAFRKKLRLVKSAQKSVGMVIVVMKRVAVFILIGAISFSTALVANAKWREQFFNWVVETFPKFSIFTMQTEEPPTSAALSQDDVVFEYLPEGYELSDIFQGRTKMVYKFLNSDGDKVFTISFTVSKVEAKSYFNTEESEIERIPFKDSEAYAWKTDKLTYFIWFENNMKCQILGDFDYNEVIKIAEYVKFKN